MDEFRHREPSSLLDNERVRTSRAVVIVYIRFVNMLLPSHPMSQTRGFAHYQYYSSTITSGAQPRAESRSSEHEIFLYWKPPEGRNLQAEWDHPNTRYFLVDRSPNSQLPFMTSKLTRTRGICFSFWLLHFCLVTPKWLGESLSPWSSHLSLPQWSPGRIVWISRSYCRTLAAGTKWLRFRWYYGQNSLWTRCDAGVIRLRCSGRRSPHGRPSRIELYVEFCLFLSRRSRDQIYWSLLICVEHLV